MPAAIVRAFWTLAVLLACAAPAGAVDVTYTYDALGRLTSATYNCSSGASYVYDAAGNRTSSGTTAPGTCPPLAVNDAVTTAFQTAVTFDPRSNDSSPVGYPFTITATGAAGHGTVAILSGGVGVTYTPATGYSGADSFTYTITDSHSLTASATVAVTVTP